MVVSSASVPSRARSLIQGLITVDAATRLTAREVLENSLFDIFKSVVIFIKLGLDAFQIKIVKLGLKMN